MNGLPGAMKRDSTLTLISNSIQQAVPAKSIFICGSKAIAGSVSQQSDYDIGVVMNTFFIPFYIRKLKGLESRLKQELGAEIAINPLPLFRLRRAKGNLFLFKLKREGITLYGDNFIETLSPGDTADIADYWYFSYLFSAMKGLVSNFDPDFLYREPDGEQSRRLLQDATKAALHCGEIRLLLNGCYETRAEDMISQLRELDVQSTAYPLNLKDLELSLSIRRGELVNLPQALAFWFRAREYLFITFKVLMRHCLGADSGQVEDLAQEYLRRGNKAWLKNLQYFALTMLLKGKLFWRSIMTRHSIEDSVRIALLWLLLALGEDGCIKRAFLSQSYAILKGYVNIEYSGDDITLWRNVKDSLMTYSTFAFAMTGV